jgi:hypothetical protein
MTVRKTVTDGDKLTPKLEDLMRRCAEGTLPTRYVVRAIQEMNEGNFVIGGLLRFVGTIRLRAVNRFVVADHFKVGALVGGRPVGWVGANFQKHFYGVTEENVPAKSVYVWELVKNSRDAPVITLFGGDESPKTQTHLAHQFQMMGLGEKGKSRLDGYANFGYKKSQVDSSLWVPYWGVDGGEFVVEARSSSFPDEWYTGNRIVGG